VAQEAIQAARILGAKLAAEAREREAEATRARAVERYGQWGPDLLAAAAYYGQDPGELYRVMMCESRGDPYADNGICKGLFQFHPDTWAGTPYGGSDIFDGHAQVKAAAWMFGQGRANEWSCY